MKKILIFPVLLIGIIPLIYAVDFEPETESGSINWKFCDGEKTLNYKVFNGTLHDTAHLRLADATTCDQGAKTDLQLQLFHKSNNQTDFTLTLPEDLEDEIIDVRVVGYRYLENFQFNSTHNSLEFSDFTHDKNGLVTIILDLKAD